MVAVEVEAAAAAPIAVVEKIEVVEVEIAAVEEETAAAEVETDAVAEIDELKTARGKRRPKVRRKQIILTFFPEEFFVTIRI